MEQTDLLSSFKPNGALMHIHHFNRGRGKGRGNGYPCPLTKFTEEFDFMAMNEKFNKDEVWGHLGKSKYVTHDSEGGENDDEFDDNLEEEDAETDKHEIKPVYVKDDFFDTLSSNTLERDSQGRRIFL
ncbi:protein decapping 5-like [Asparagus officinalis]|uniref:protein decapping 5-like n=1 Tax=Asparagus officinalis TaxID=4686 RepID=UPI00098E4EC3|nr:protein decapping 5-like [Asparagus officinalis]